MTKSTSTPTPIVQQESSMIPLIGVVIALLAVLACYFLYKKMNSMTSQTESVIKLEEKFSKFIKEQNEINTLYTKKFNSVGSEFNQFHYILQEHLINNKPDNDFISQSSPNIESDIKQNIKDLKHSNDKIKSVEEIQQPEQRQMMPTSVFQTSLPGDNTIPTELPHPVSTINKKGETLNDKIPVLNDNNIKKVVTISSNEEVYLEEDSSDDEN
jgi:hypothetical protein